MSVQSASGVVLPPRAHQPAHTRPRGPVPKISRNFQRDVPATHIEPVPVAPPDTKPVDTTPAESILEQQPIAQHDSYVTEDPLDAKIREVRARLEAERARALHTATAPSQLLSL